MQQLFLLLYPLKNIGPTRKPAKNGKRSPPPKLLSGTPRMLPAYIRVWWVIRWVFSYHRVVGHWLIGSLIKALIVWVLHVLIIRTLHVFLVTFGKG